MILVPILSALCSPAVPLNDATDDVTGRYVEARTASVFAGACHYGGERTTAGREALMVWTIDAGSTDGVDLSGLCAAALVADETNLDDAPSARRSVLYLPAAVAPAQRDALARWVSARAGATLGDVVAVELVPLSVVVGAETYSAALPGTFALSGDSLPDHACCKMPFQVWYEPLVAIDHRLVGHDSEFTVDERALGCAWSRPDENAVFFGRFGPVRVQRASDDGTGTAN
jgi:hypothetical protein